MSILDRFRLTGRRLFITGGSRGLGREMALAIADAGADVILVGRDEASLATAAGEIRALGRECLVIPGDVGEPEECERVCREALEHHPDIDILINNVGGRRINVPLVEQSLEQWRENVDLNLTSAFLCMKHVGGAMVRRGGPGRVINVASISGLRASTMRVAYGTSKAAVIHLTKQQAVELSHFGIRVNAIAPGPVDTAMAKLVHTAAVRADYHDAIPLARYGAEEEMAQVVGFLCSDAAAYVNGQVVAVDGGFDAAGVGLPTLRRDLGARD
jgi:NAD(P)-dependent dehydrogenase (short-subunit alcohol dehydrogenase family)